MRGWLSVSGRLLPRILEPLTGVLGVSFGAVTLEICPTHAIFRFSAEGVGLRPPGVSAAGRRPSSLQGGIHGVPRRAQPDSDKTKKSDTSGAYYRPTRPFRLSTGGRAQHPAGHDRRRRLRCLRRCMRHERYHSCCRRSTKVAFLCGGILFGCCLHCPYHGGSSL
jgi:hypothetical protein